MVTFADLGVPTELIDALDAQGIRAPFPIQQATIPAALAGRDVCGRAPTGSGKTLAFGIPLVMQVQRARPKRPRALVLVPTRELAAQVTQDLAWLGAKRDVRVQSFYGGTRFEIQTKALRRGVDIAVATPGRITDLVNRGVARLDGVDLVVVDEADRMADMGFLPEVRRLVDQTDADRQTLLFSATLDGDVDALINRYQHDPVTVDVTPPESEHRLEHHFWSVAHPDRVATTAAIIDRVGPTIVFTRTRHGADRVAGQLERAGVQTAAIHGDRSQGQRERALRAFRTGHARALVATDVAARGIHVDDVACVVHFDLPQEPKDYVHRSGRTGRAGATGVVIGLAMPDRRKDTRKLLRELDLGVRVTEPDIGSLPAGTPTEPIRQARHDSRHEPRPGQSPRGSGSGPKSGKRPKSRHKPSGSSPGPAPGSPGDTKPGRRKTAGKAKPRRHGGGPGKGAGPGGARRKRKSKTGYPRTPSDHGDRAADRPGADPPSGRPKGPPGQRPGRPRKPGKPRGKGPKSRPSTSAGPKSPRKKTSRPTGSRRGPGPTAKPERSKRNTKPGRRGPSGTP